MVGNLSRETFILLRDLMKEETSDSGMYPISYPSNVIGSWSIGKEIGKEGEIGFMPKRTSCLIKIFVSIFGG